MTNVELNLNPQNPNHQDHYHFNGENVQRDMMIDDACNQMMDALKSSKACSNCNTTKTSLWRSGPLGPKSLCNACYLKNRKYNKKKGVEKKSGGSKKIEDKALQAAEILVFMSSPYRFKHS